MGKGDVEGFSPVKWELPMKPFPKENGGFTRRGFTGRKDVPPRIPIPIGKVPPSPTDPQGKTGKKRVTRNPFSRPPFPRLWKGGEKGEFPPVGHWLKAL